MSGDEAVRRRPERHRARVAAAATAGNERQRAEQNRGRAEDGRPGTHGSLRDRSADANCLGTP